MPDTVPPPFPADSSSELASAVEPLQFDRAEFVGTSAGTTCTMCQTALETEYFEINGAVVCDGCRRQFAAWGTQGTGAARFTRAVAAGVLAGAAGSAVYFLISKLTGYEFGLIAVLVGFAVGAAVKWGCYGRGGALYQALAVALTYLAIVSTYVPPLIEAFRAQEMARAASADTRAASSNGVVTPAATPPDATAQPEEPPTLGGFLSAITILLLIACAAPFLAGLQNVIGILIIGFGLYEAWKINKRPVFAITGPHALASAAAARAPLGS